MAKESKRDIVYKVVTDSLINGLERAIENNDAAPWQKPWTVLPGEQGKAPMAIRKWMNGKTYRGINVWILLASGQQGPWLTWNQCKKAGGRVKPSETKRFTVISFWKILETEEDGKKKKIPMLRYYRVYSLDQCEGLKEKRWMRKEREEAEAKADQPEPEVIANPFGKAEQIWADYKDKPELKHGGGRAYYAPFLDYIKVPDKERFTAMHSDPHEAFGHYWSTLFHEAAHSTGHSTRLNRFDNNQADHIFGSESYSQEELIAEMTAAYLQSFAGIEVSRVRENNVAYLRNWIKNLKDDPKMAVQAASKAQKACDHIMGVTWEDDPKESAQTEA